MGESQPSPLAKRHHEVGTQAGGQDPAKEAERGLVMAPRAALLAPRRGGFVELREMEPRSPEGGLMISMCCERGHVC